MANEMRTKEEREAVFAAKAKRIKSAIEIRELIGDLVKQKETTPSDMARTECEVNIRILEAELARR